MILCDLPYGITACSWDSAIPLHRLWELYRRIIKPNGVIALFGKEPFTSELILSNKNTFCERITWLKNKAGNGFMSSQRHIQVVEDICVFSASSKHTFNAQKWLVADKEFLTQRKTMCEFECGNTIYGPKQRVRKPDVGERNPINIVCYPVPINKAKTKTYSPDIETRCHPTQKPVALCEYLIKTYSNAGETVLDNCMGSGTTGVACLKTGRKFIGIELDATYCEIAVDRIQHIV